MPEQTLAAAEVQAVTEEHEYVVLSRTPGGGGLDDISENTASCRRRTMPGLSTAARNGWRDPRRIREARSPDQAIWEEMVAVAERDLGRALPPDVYELGGATPRRWMLAWPHRRGHSAHRSRHPQRGRRRRASTARDDGEGSGLCDCCGDAGAVAPGLQVAGGAR